MLKELTAQRLLTLPFPLFWLQGFSLSSTSWLALPFLPVKPGTLSLFFTPTKRSRLSWGACKTGAQTEQKQEVKGHTFSFVRLIGQVYLEGTETQRAFFSRGHTPSSSAEAGRKCVWELQRSSESRDLGQAQWESHYSPIGVSCDLKDR